MSALIAADEQYRPSSPAPIQDFQSNGGIDRDEPHLMRRRIAPAKIRRLRSQQIQCDEERVMWLPGDQRPNGAMLSRHLHD